MSFADAAAYDRFMGRFSTPLAQLFIDLGGARPGQRALDVGCGTGALSRILCDRLGADAVSAVDPSGHFVSATLSAFPGIDARVASAENLPFATDTFDATYAQLVVPFMEDPVAGLTEMARVTRPGGSVCACVWDHAGGRSPVSVFWQSALEIDAGVSVESEQAGAAAGALGELFRAAHLPDIRTGALIVSAAFTGFDEWWETFTLGVGPAGAYVRTLTADAVETLAERCHRQLPTGPFTITARAWTAIGRAPV